MKPKAVFDVECYRNFFCICFQDIATGARKSFEMYDGHPLDVQGVVRVLKSFTVIGFNSANYDLPMIRCALRGGVSNSTLKTMSDAIIRQNLKPWDCEREFLLVNIPWVDMIDIIEPAPSVAVGLKLYAARLHSRRLQDLPIEPDAFISEFQRKQLVEYCFNDLLCTIDLYRHIEPQLDLRAAMSQQYDVDLRSKSDAQIAEAVIRHELERISGDKLSRPSFPSGYSFKYQAPSFIEFKTPVMQEALALIESETFSLDYKGDVQMPKTLSAKKIKIGKSTYRMGIGGLHSSESKVSYQADDDMMLRDADVASFYPAIILNCELYPDHLGQDFLAVYRTIRQRRIAAKRAKDKVADMTLKITLNGTFGKLGSRWSFLYSPNLMIQVTLTGQLVLLMLIEELELAGIRVISANTDGIVSYFDRGMLSVYEDIVKRWERRTGFEMEFADYDALYSRDVNNYIAVKVGGGVKQKGAFAFVGSKGSPAEKNPTTYVCIDAVIEYLTKGTPIMDTLEWCPDIRRFLSVRRVTGGATYDGQYLGKTVRWYMAKGSTQCIRRATNGDKVARTDGCRPMMNLEGLPSDLDFEWYYHEAVAMLGDLGVL